MHTMQKTDQPPPYSQTFTPTPTATAPLVEFATMASPGLMQPHHPHAIFIQSAPVQPLGPRPCIVTCPSCHQRLMSNVRHETATKTHLFAALLCLVGLFPCACIPYFMNTCKNPNHYCNNCDAYLGTYNNK